MANIPTGPRSQHTAAEQQRSVNGRSIPTGPRKLQISLNGSDGSGNTLRDGKANPLASPPARNSFASAVAGSSKNGMSAIPSAPKAMAFSPSTSSTLSSPAGPSTQRVGPQSQKASGQDHQLPAKPSSITSPPPPIAPASVRQQHNRSAQGPSTSSTQFYKPSKAESEALERAQRANATPVQAISSSSSSRRTSSPPPFRSSLSHPRNGPHIQPTPKMAISLAKPVGTGLNLARSAVGPRLAASSSGSFSTDSLSSRAVPPMSRGSARAIAARHNVFADDAAEESADFALKQSRQRREKSNDARHIASLAAEMRQASMMPAEEGTKAEEEQAGQEGHTAAALDKGKGKEKMVENGVPASNTSTRVAETGQVGVERGTHLTSNLDQGRSVPKSRWSTPPAPSISLPVTVETAVEHGRCRSRSGTESDQHQIDRRKHSSVYGSPLPPHGVDMAAQAPLPYQTSIPRPPSPSYSRPPPPPPPREAPPAVPPPPPPLEEAYMPPPPPSQSNQLLLPETLPPPPPIASELRSLPPSESQPPSPPQPLHPLAYAPPVKMNAPTSLAPASPVNRHPLPHRSPTEAIAGSLAPEHDFSDPARLSHLEVLSVQNPEAHSQPLASTSSPLTQHAPAERAFFRVVSKTSSTIRYEGEGVAKPVSDPRIAERIGGNFSSYSSLIAKSTKNMRLFTKVGRVGPWEYDKYSTGPPPPPVATAIMVTGLSRLTTPDKIRQHFAMYGIIRDMEYKTDPKTGGFLGLCRLKYIDEVARVIYSRNGPQEKAATGTQDGNHSALEALKKNHDCKVPTLAGNDGKLQVCLDGEGVHIARAVQAELDKRYGKPKPSAQPGRKSASATPRHMDGSSTEQIAISRPQAATSSAAVPSASQSRSPEQAVRTTSILPSRPAFLPAKPALQPSNRDAVPPVSRALQTDGATASRSARPIPSTPAGPSSPQKVATPQTAGAVRGPYKLATNRSAERYASSKASRSTSPSSSSSGADSDDDERRREREEDDKVFFPRSRGRGDQTKTSNNREDLNAELLAGDEIVKNLRSRLEAARILLRHAHLHVRILRTDLADVASSRRQPINRTSLRAWIGRHNPQEILEDPGAYYVLFRDSVRAQTAQRDLAERRFAGFLITTTVEEAPNVDAVREIEDELQTASKRVLDQKNAPIISKNDLLRDEELLSSNNRQISKRDPLSSEDIVIEARRLIVRELKESFANDLRNRVVPPKIAEIWNQGADRGKDGRVSPPKSTHQGQSSPHQDILSQDAPSSSSRTHRASLALQATLEDGQSAPPITSTLSALPSFARKKAISQGPAASRNGDDASRRHHDGRIRDSYRPRSESRLSESRRLRHEVPEPPQRSDRTTLETPASDNDDDTESVAASEITLATSVTAGDNKQQRQKGQKVIAASSESESENEVPKPIKAAKPKGDKSKAAKKAKPQISFTSSESESSELSELTDLSDSAEEAEEKALTKEKDDKAQKSGKPAQQDKPDPASDDDTAEVDPETVIHPDSKTLERIIPILPEAQDEVIISEIYPSDVREIGTDAVALLSPPATVVIKDKPSLSKRELSLDDQEAEVGLLTKKTRINSPTPAQTEEEIAGASSAIEAAIDSAQAEEDAEADTEAIVPPPKKTAKGKKGFRRKAKGKKRPAQKAQGRSASAAAEPDKLDDLASLGFGDDEEDYFFARVVLQRMEAGKALYPPEPPIEPELPDDLVMPEPRHEQGCARLEGYYKIPQAEKLSYLAQRNQAQIDSTQVGTSSIAVSRLARANARHLVSGLDKNKKSASDADVLQFNQLRTRKKQIRFARSPIHDWGLYASEYIPPGEMVIEYVGEQIRQQVADKREKAYERQGIGSSYLFRVDDDVVIDATMKGNLGRLINHCCTPNCTARILSVGNSKKIVIYAKAAIHEGDEITYDYHFPLEDEKIPCLCGSSGCRGFLN